MNNAPKPGDLPLGSVESRMAMRAAIKSEEEKPQAALIVTLMGHPPHPCKLWCLSGARGGPRCVLEKENPEYKVIDGRVRRIFHTEAGNRGNA
jgi:hypothetical protein